ncbi:MAG TPA: UDP-N-acetylmuramoyl-tripeptide--D-alanyl-D-alanine ligase [Bacillota bacterium]|nr:UDP-N-acetylmuramoyl-tripeptide--D-alanyl-D-alanine ligase [Bacillota bacterium]
MQARSLQFITTACAGELLSGSASAGVSRVCTDSRQLQPGDLFLALPGERFDGHDFLPEVAKKAAALVAERHRLVCHAGRWSVLAANGVPRELDLGSCALIAVDHTRQALGRLAERYRAEFALPVVAVGGSNGKTTTKELIASVLKQKLATLWSEASFNNDIGVPLTLLKLDGSHQAAVLEVGTNHPGELAPLVRMVQPRYGVITSIGREHLEYFGDVAGVAQEEGWLAELLPAQGKLILNGDSEWTEQVVRRTGAAVVRVGFADGNQWRVRSLRLDKQGVAFRVEAPQPDFAGEYRVNLLGRHQAGNALLAVALGAELGLSRAEIERGLAECKPAKMRLQLWEANGVRVLDDAYNANADSMIAALQTLQGLPCKGRRVAVLGDMAELGAHAEAAHEEVGRQAAQLGVGQLFAVGQMASLLARGARRAGLTRIFEFTDVEAAGAAIKKFVKNGDLVLLKASRATRLERIAELLRGADAVRKN